MASKRHFHLFEFHLHGDSIQFGPRSIGGRDYTESAEEEAAETESHSTGSTESGPGRARIGLAALLGLGLLAALAIGVKRLTGGKASLEDIEVLEESEGEHEPVEA